MVLGVISIVFGLLLLSVAVEALRYDEPFAGALAGMCGTVFVLGGWKALAA